MFSSILQWLFDLVMWIPRFMIKLLLDGLIALLNTITPPDFFNDLGGWLGAIPDSVWFFASAFNISFGLKVVLGAYTIRFILRLIPFIC